MTDEPDIPTPPRFWWLKRLAVAYALFIAAIIGTWIAWDIAAKRKFDAEVDRLHAMGQLVYAADFNNRPAVPDEKNAATVYRQAMNFTLTKAQDDLDSNLDLNLKLTDNQRAILRSFPVDYAANLQLARQARQLQRAQWVTGYASPLINTNLTHLNPERGLANLISRSATAQHLDGDDAEAVESTRDLLHLARMSDVDNHTLVEHLVATGLNAMAAGKVDEFGMELGIEGPQPPLRQASTQPSTRPARPATRQQVKSLIAELLDEHEVIDGMVQAQQGEQAEVLDTLGWLTSSANAGATTLWGGGSPMPSAASLLFMRPILRLSAVRLSQRYSGSVDAARQTKFPEMTARLPDLEREMMGQTWPRQMAHVVDRIMGMAPGRTFEMHARVLCERRAAAITLAMRLYQIDHGGQLPDTLDALVPTYLAAIPRDPFAKDDRPFGYVKSAVINDVETPLIYSVAENGTDDHASTRPTSYRANYTRGKTVFEYPYDRDDRVFPLKQPLPADPPPPETDSGLPEPMEIAPATQPASREAVDQ